MAGRPPLRIGQHGKISRRYLGGGVWMATCRYRDVDGVTRKVQKLGPADEFDKHGKLAEDALVEALAERRPPASTPDAITLDTALSVLIDHHIARLAEDGRSPRTIDAYRYTAGKFMRFIGGVRVREATPPRIDAALRSMRNAHGPGMAKQSKAILRGALQLAVMATVIGANPVRDVPGIKLEPAVGATALTADELRGLLVKLATSQYCRDHDLVGPITLLIATGLRRSELLGLRWADYDASSGEITVTGRVVRVAGKGLVREQQTKSKAGRRTIRLPKFAVEMLTQRRQLAYLGQHPVIMFPSTAGTWRDPCNFNRVWRGVRDELGVPGISSHSFRKSIADLIDDEGLSARVGADQLGHSKVSMTQDVYLTRGRVHSQVADLLDRTVAGRDVSVSISGE
jgi:integrase